MGDLWGDRCQPPSWWDKFTNMIENVFEGIWEIVTDWGCIIFFLFGTFFFGGIGLLLWDGLHRYQQRVGG